MCKLLWQLLFSLISGPLYPFCWCWMLNNSNSLVIQVPPLSPLPLSGYILATKKKKKGPSVDRIFVPSFLLLLNVRKPIVRTLLYRILTSHLASLSQFSNCLRQYFCFALVCFKKLWHLLKKKKKGQGGLPHSSSKLYTLGMSIARELWFILLCSRHFP
jgi:hypothetical protein